jgi:hypothetical protein
MGNTEKIEKLILGLPEEWQQGFSIQGIACHNEFLMKLRAATDAFNKTNSKSASVNSLNPNAPDIFPTTSNPKFDIEPQLQAIVARLDYLSEQQQIQSQNPNFQQSSNYKAFEPRSYNNKPRRALTREHLEYLLQKIQFRDALSETGATIRTQSTSPPSSTVFRTVVTIGNETYNSLVDSGASISAVNPDVLVKSTNSITKRQKIRSFTFKLSVGNSESLCVNEIVTLNFYANSIMFSWKFYVIKGLSNPVVIGMDWLSENDTFLCCRLQNLFFGVNPAQANPVPQFQQITIPGPSQSSSETIRSKETNKVESIRSVPKRPRKTDLPNFLFTVSPSELKPNHFCPIEVMCSNSEFNSDILVTNNTEFELEKMLLIGRSVIPMRNGRGQVWIVNANNYKVRIPPNSKIGSFEPYKSKTEQYDVTNVEMNYLQDLYMPETPENDSIPQLCSIEESNRADKLFEACKFGEKLTPEQEDRIKSLLVEYLDCFSFSDEKIGCAIGVKHKINTGNAVPIRQRAYLPQNAT